MRRLIAALALTSLMGIGSGDVLLTQSPGSSPAGFERRAQISDAGFVVSFPEGWVIETTFGEPRAVSPDGAARCLLSGEHMPEPVDDPAALLDRVAEIYPNFSDDGPLPVIETSEVQLPAARAIRFVTDFSLDGNLVESEDERYATMYILADGRTLLFLGCWSRERAEDDWLSIAETIEFLPATE